MMTLDELKKAAEPNFLTPVLKEFFFLEEEHGFSVSGSAVSYETSIVYSSQNTQICIFHAFPETPCLVFRNLNQGKVKKEKWIKTPKMKSNVFEFKEFVKICKTIEIDLWLNNFRKGDFNFIFAHIIRSYAEIVKEDFNKIVNGDFDSIKI